MFITNFSKHFASFLFISLETLAVKGQLPFAPENLEREDVILCTEFKLTNGKLVGGNRKTFSPLHHRISVVQNNLILISFDLV